MPQFPNDEEESEDVVMDDGAEEKEAPPKVMKTAPKQKSRPNPTPSSAPAVETEQNMAEVTHAIPARRKPLYRGSAAASTPAG